MNLWNQHQQVDPPKPPLTIGESSAKIVKLAMDALADGHDEYSVWVAVNRGLFGSEEYDHLLRSAMYKASQDPDDVHEPIISQFKSFFIRCGDRFVDKRPKRGIKTDDF